MPRARSRDPADTKSRLLAAAAALSAEVGPARVSLDAVAARAGVSKGGLLYHYPSKHALLRALVEDHVEDRRAAIEAHAPGALERQDATAAAHGYLAMMRESLCCGEPPPSGVFAAIAEDPEFIAPLRDFRREMLERVFRRLPEPRRAMLLFLACEGMVHLKLTDADSLEPGLCEAAIDEMERLLGTLGDLPGNCPDR
jgi:AcrR family transcriptional regulator